MAPKSAEIPVKIRDLIIKDWQGDKNVRLTLNQIAQKYKLAKSTDNLPRPGRPPKLTPREKRSVIQEVRIKPFVSAPEIVTKLQEQLGKKVSTKTVKRVLRKSGYKSQAPRKKPCISNKNQAKRLAFARAHVGKPASFWKSVLWSDETKINLFGSDGHRKVFRKTNEALNPKNILPTVKHGGGSVMVWGCFPANGVGNLEFIDGIMTGAVYVDILQRNLKDSARKIGLNRNFTFQEDNDPKHTSKVGKQYFEQHKIKLLEWVPQSPDINPIEHLWDYLKRELRKSTSSNKEDLKTRIREIWSNIPRNMTNNLVDSIPRRLEAVIAARGGPTKY